MPESKIPLKVFRTKAAFHETAEIVIDGVRFEHVHGITTHGPVEAVITFDKNDVPICMLMLCPLCYWTTSMSERGE